MFLVRSIMNTHSSITTEEALEAEAPLDPDGEREGQLLRVLGRLTELGMVLAERLVAQVTADAAAPIDPARGRRILCRLGTFRLTLAEMFLFCSR